LSTFELSLPQPCAQDLLGRVRAAGVAHGVERSFKFVPGLVLPGRVLVGMPIGSPAHAQGPLAIAEALGLAKQARALLEPALARANAVLLACEEQQDGTVLYKAYLEFWDEVRKAAEHGDRRPRLLHLGVKWYRTRPHEFVVAQYTCHPLLDLRELLRRMAMAYAAEPPPMTLPVVQRIVRTAAMREPRPSLVYLDATEKGNVRHSFDVNLYPCGLTVGDVAEELRIIGRHLSIEASQVEDVIASAGTLPVGHLSGGCDREGREFLSVYAELASLPAAGSTR
jgi:hypothetical protein